MMGTRRSKVGETAAINERTEQFELQTIVMKSSPPEQLEVVKPSDAVDKTPAAERVFAIPELLEHILLALDLHTKAPFSFSSLSNARELCRLESVSRAFRATIKDSAKLQESRDDLDLNQYHRDHLPMIWLLREFGHGDFGISICHTYGCCTPQDEDHQCDWPNLKVGEMPAYLRVSACKKAFENAIAGEQSWRAVKISRRFKIYFRWGEDECRQASIEGGTMLGDVWDVLKECFGRRVYSKCPDNHPYPSKCFYTWPEDLADDIRECLDTWPGDLYDDDY